MASSKDTFEPDTFEANTFACGTWRGVGVDVVDYEISHTFTLGNRQRQFQLDNRQRQFVIDDK